MATDDEVIFSCFILNLKYEKYLEVLGTIILRITCSLWENIFSKFSYKKIVLLANESLLI